MSQQRRALVPLALASVLAACSQQTQPAPAQSAGGEAAAGPTQEGAAAPAPAVGRARVCEVPSMGRYRSGAGTQSMMTVSNEGGWCAKGYTRDHANGFTGGDIIDRPEHGEARIRHLPTRSLVEYRPTPGYLGSDRFTATLTPGGGTYIVAVTVRQ